MPIPEGELITGFGELENLARSMGMPLIIKPPDSSGSRGVSSARKESDLRASFENARAFSETVIIEELIRGVHIDVNGLFLENVFHPCGTLDRFFSDPPLHYPVWGCQPSSLPEEKEKQAYQLVERGARSVGINAGPVKGDVIFTESGPVLLEIAPRFHGDVSTSFVSPSAIGFSPIRSWFDFLAGRSVEALPGDDACTAVGWMALFPEAPGKLVSIRGIESARAIFGILDVVPTKAAGASPSIPRSIRSSRAGLPVVPAPTAPTRRRLNRWR